MIFHRFVPAAALCVLSLTACENEPSTAPAEANPAFERAGASPAAQPSPANDTNTGGAPVAPDPENAGQASNPDARLARCVVDSNGNETYSGPCEFEAEGGGSFTISRPDDAAIGGAVVISVSVIDGGEAEVRGLTRDGINSRWGRAERSSRDPACWVGSDFSVCAY